MNREVLLTRRPGAGETITTTKTETRPSLGWPLWATIIGTLFLRSASFATGALLGLALGLLDRHGWEINDFEIGLLGAIFFAVELVGAPVVGVLIDRRGFRAFLLLGPIAGLISVLLEGSAAATAIAASEEQGIGALVGFLGGVAVVMPLLFLARSFHGLSAAASIPATLAFISAQTGQDAVRRSRAMAFFEVATIVGMGAGASLAGVLWDYVGVLAFMAAAVLYLLSLILFASAAATESRAPQSEAPVVTPRSREDDAQARVPAGASSGGAQNPELATVATQHPGLRETAQFLSEPRVLRFVPAWIAVNAIVGLWIYYMPFLLTQTKDPNQLLVGGFTGTMVSGVYIGVVASFLGGIVGWGYALGRWSPTRVMRIGVFGLYGLVGSLFAINHATGVDVPVLFGLAVVALLTLGVAAGFTPAALTYLAILAEEYAERRGAIMGLYSVFLGVGQGLGIILGGVPKERFGADGMIGLTLLLTVAAMVFVHRLSAHERITPSGRTVARGEATGDSSKRKS